MKKTRRKITHSDKRSDGTDAMIRGTIIKECL